MKSILKRLFDGHELTQSEANHALKMMVHDKTNEHQKASFLTVFLMRPISIVEIMGFREAMLELCIPISLESRKLIDLCGTGGDEKNTFNISTIAAFVVAGAGVPVAKHGNYGVSSISGSSNVLEALGCKFSKEESTLQKSLEKANLCFLHAPLFHPAMKNVAPTRKGLGLKTFFNMIGPMVNPAQPYRQIIGVYSLKLARMYQHIYQQLHKKFFIIHSLDGYDEISLTGDFKMLGNKIQTVFSPTDFGLKPIAPKEIYGGDTISQAKDIFVTILEQRAPKAHMEVVLANAGVAIALSKDISFSEGLQFARESLTSGSALKSLKKFIEVNA